MTRATLTLIGKPGCHLCDKARDVVAGVVNDLAASAPSLDVTVNEASILDDATLHEKYVEEIPVLLVNGVVHTYWRVDAARLTSALRELA